MMELNLVMHRLMRLYLESRKEDVFLNNFFFREFHLENLYFKII